MVSVLLPLTLLGFGSSDKPEDVELYSHHKQGERIKEIVEFLKLENWTHVVHDGGGIWTWEALLQGLKPSKLVILNTIVFKEGFKPPMKFKRNLIGEQYAKTYLLTNFRWSNG